MKSPIKEYWEEKLNIKYDIELEYYKKLCGKKYNKKLLSTKSDLHNNEDYITYNKWRSHILKTIENLTADELEEYSKFLNQQYRNKNTKLGSFNTLLIPFGICVIGGVVIAPAFDIIMKMATNNDFSLDCKYIVSSTFAFSEICIILFVVLLFYWLNNTHDNESVLLYFYQDIKEIVDKRIEGLYKKVQV